MNTTPPEDTQRSATPPPDGTAGSATVRIKITMGILEYHTFEREVDAAEFERERNEGDVMDWLEKQFQDDPMPDSDISTDSVELDAWKIIKPNTEVSSGAKTIYEANNGED